MQLHAKDLNSWIPPSDSFLLQHIEYIPHVIQTVATEERHPGEILKILYRYHSEEVKSLANKLIEPFMSVLSTYSRAINFISANEEHEQILNLHVKVVQTILS